MIAVGVLRRNTPQELAGIRARFEPDAVPLVDGHLGRPVGWVRDLMVDGSDIWLVCATDDGPMGARLRRGPIAASAEIQGVGVVFDPAGDGQRIPGLMPSTSYRGKLGSGWTLLAVALLPPGVPPARPGSAMWATV